ncbi:uncharacterized protein MYCGRDRAFT_103903 [Zymoseptoria tritici IPO323]|uniref:Uncharacterized protein n=1 Tax=Zymoseptoria tritici (strain CBS 115943 / IPO323) TaxID=336722 RepID=F9X5V3_ZYMTI|nr:uncharacterized protein MYCGRDRAFT_103903 [Zymoseptoria tritici IPO323]EGP89221.1 hypothetical protein MYCGRDRAFT_103903 [Zymoseptoria tritici IPO323]
MQDLRRHLMDQARIDAVCQMPTTTCMISWRTTFTCVTNWKHFTCTTACFKRTIRLEHQDAPEMTFPPSRKSTMK